MRHTTRTSALLVVLVLAVPALGAQSTDSPQALLRIARDTAIVDGDLDAAIAQYRTIVETFASDRGVVATALVRMASLYEKLGAPEARATYTQVLNDYADQIEPVATARARLTALDADQTPQKPAMQTELLWPDARGVSPQGDVSPDGVLVTYVDWLDGGNLAIRNLTTGDSRRLTHSADNGSGDNGGHYAAWSRFSPDGDRVMFSWNRSSPAGETGELRLVSVRGDQAEPRTVWSPADGSYAHLQDWFPSGDAVVAVVGTSGSSSIVIVSILDGETRQVRSIDWTDDVQVRVSPDGRWLAYSRSESRDVREKDISLVSVDGSSEASVVQHAADDELVAWSPDGRYVLFNSDRTGQPALWAQRLQDAKPVGEPRLLIPNLDVGAGMGVTRDGTLYYPVRVTRRRMKLAELDVSTGRLLRQPVAVTDEFVGGNSNAVFSPDGERIAYTQEREERPAIVIRSLKTGEEFDVPHRLSSVGRLVWRPDGERLAVNGRDDQGRYGLFDIVLATGRVQPLVNVPDIMTSPAFTPDGMRILLRKPVENRESIYSYDVVDGSVEKLPGVFPGGFSLSPDGQWIATLGGQQGFGTLLGNFGTEIRLHPATGGDGKVLLTAPEGERFGRWTTWTPDGTALLVLKGKPEAGDDMWRLWVVPVDGSDPIATELIYEPANAGARAISIHPDGRRIVYAEGGYVHQFWAVHNLGLGLSAPASQ